MGAMVASSQKAASGVGIGILKAGGNAADAAVAMAAALNVTEPCSTGIGGDCFALYFQGGEISALNGSGRSPKDLKLKDLPELPTHHANTVTVPGACAGWFDFLERHGSMSMSDVLAPAIALAETGFEVQPITAHFWARGVDTLTGPDLTIDGRAPKAGETFRNPNLAKTFRAISEGGRDAFYKGPIADAIVKAVRDRGGAMVDADLKKHTSTWDEPISTTYKDLTVWECPPNGQGIAALIALNILKGFDVEPGPDRWHLAIEAMRLAFADTRWYVTDPAKKRVPVAALLSESYAEERRKLIDPKKASADTKKKSPAAGSDTVYFCTVDADGNACSFINSNYMGFGTGIIPDGWGFTLQNRGHNFSLDPKHPNKLAPRKRPYHTIIPGLLTRADESLFAPFGVMGGFMQPQGHLQVVLHLTDGLEPQAVLDAPRFCIEDRVYLEEGFDKSIVEDLKRRGHDVVEGLTGFDRSKFGRGQIIRRDPDGTLAGGTDPRADGCVSKI